MSLDKCQEKFARALSKGDFDEAEDWVQPAGLDSQRRLWVYFHQLRSVWCEALETSYPAVRALVGKRCFRRLTQKYAQQYTAPGDDLREYGEHFPDTLENDAGAALYPYLPDVGRLEWARLHSLYAPEFPPIEMTVMASLDAQHWPRVHFQMAPSLQMLVSPYPISRIWVAATGNINDRTLARHALEQREAEALCVYRQGYTVAVETLQPPLWRWLLALQDGRSFQEAVELACEAENRLQVPFDLCFALQWLFRRGLVAGISDAEPPHG